MRDSVCVSVGLVVRCGPLSLSLVPLPRQCPRPRPIFSSWLVWAGEWDREGACSGANGG